VCSSDLVAGEAEPVMALLGDNLRVRDWLSRYLGRININAAQLMSQYNPRVVLRNYLAPQVIEQSEPGDYSELAKLHAALRTPCKEGLSRDFQPVPDGDRNVSLSCSS